MLRQTETSKNWDSMQNSDSDLNCIWVAIKSSTVESEEAEAKSYLTAITVNCEWADVAQNPKVRRESTWENTFLKNLIQRKTTTCPLWSCSTKLFICQFKKNLISSLVFSLIGYIDQSSKKIFFLFKMTNSIKSTSFK